MPTYGRPEFVAEALSMFLDQDYPAKELIILNDCHKQTFNCSIPGVKVINRCSRYPSLGEKRNAAIEISQGEIIAVWDDDDVHLPWRLSFSMAEMTKWGTEFYRPAEFLAYWGEPKLHDNRAIETWVSHGPSMYSRNLWERVGGYPPKGVGEDAEFFRSIHKILEKDFVSYPIERNNRFYILRGKSLYHHMSMGGGMKPLDTSPAYIDLTPKPIQDPLLCSSRDAIVSRHDTLKNNKTIISCPTTPEAEFILSVCISVKNRSKICYKTKKLELLPNCIKSLTRAAELLTASGRIELIIADFGSNDWPLSEWINKIDGKIDITVLDITGDFSRGAGLNQAANHSRADRLLICDADMLISAEFINYCIKNTTERTALFPIMRFLNEDGSPGGWQPFSYGISCLHRRIFDASGGVPEFKSWGGEDDIFFERVSRLTTIRREPVPGLVHQWHPEHCRHENYINTRRNDYECYIGSGKLDNSADSPQIFWGAHPHWHGHLHLHSDGRLSRPGVDSGTYELRGCNLLLKWDRWPVEELFWNEELKYYESANKSFTLRELGGTTSL